MPSAAAVETYVGGDTVSRPAAAAVPPAHAAIAPAQHLTVELEHTREVVEIYA